MSLKACLKSQLATARRFSEGLLADFRTPEQWTYQVHPNANHALWFVGHMGVVDNFFVSKIAPEQVESRPEYERLFGMGSQPTSNPADYPPVEEVLAYMRQRRRTLNELLEKLDESQLEQPTLGGDANFLPTVESVFQMAIWHEGLHSGQVSIARRSMGHAPLIGGD